MLRFFVVAAILACLVVAGTVFYFTTFSPDRSEYPVRGIDVSHHQGEIDWRRVAADDIEFGVAHLLTHQRINFLHEKKNRIGVWSVLEAADEKIVSPKRERCL